MPLYKDAALQQLEFLRPILEWQSTIDDLKSPPKGFLSEGVDILRGLDDIADKLKEGKYSNEYEYLADVYTLISVRPRDAHLHYSPLLLDLVNFVPGVEFVCVSKDRLSVPEIYLHSN